MVERFAGTDRTIVGADEQGEGIGCLVFDIDHRRRIGRRKHGHSALS